MNDNPSDEPLRKPTMSLVPVGVAMVLAFLAFVIWAGYVLVLSFLPTP